MANNLIPAQKNEIVVYQPNETLRLEVMLEDRTVWLNQAQLSDLFGVTVPTINYHVKEIFATGELQAGATIRKIGSSKFLVENVGITPSVCGDRPSSGLRF